MSEKLVFLHFYSAGGLNEKSKQANLEKNYLCTVSEVYLWPKMLFGLSFFGFVITQKWKFWKLLFFYEKMVFEMACAVWLLEKPKFSHFPAPDVLIGPPAKPWRGKSFYPDNPGHKILGICSNCANFRENWPTLKVFFSFLKCKHVKIRKVPESPGTWPVITDQLPDSDLRPKILSLKSKVSSMNLRDESLGSVRPI